ncbi:MAG: hypothetical protein CVT75_09935 [Alphaproteobacteria bacterium HGW-Alphaproteobacteria-14]|nr:MAG: hypothetical protein CVT75_09935 [Alphaproteobacteria bacterium HGW-Alphaproteobacteria-14]
MVLGEPRRLGFVGKLPEGNEALGCTAMFLPCRVERVFGLGENPFGCGLRKFSGRRIAGSSALDRGAPAFIAAAVSQREDGEVEREPGIAEEGDADRILRR